jgi:hypothetical protein
MYCQRDKKKIIYLQNLSMYFLLSGPSPSTTSNNPAASGKNLGRILKQDI